MPVKRKKIEHKVQTDNDEADVKKMADKVEESGNNILAKKKKKAKIPDSLNEVTADEPSVKVSKKRKEVDVNESPDEKEKIARSGKRLKKERKKAAAEAEANALARSADNETESKGADNASKNSDKDDACTIFVSGVPYIWNEDKIRDTFAKCGTIMEIRAPVWQDSGRLRGFAHVTFDSQAARELALGEDGLKVGAKGRYLKVEAAKLAAAKESVDPQDLVGKRRLFVKNLPYDASEPQIKELFERYGKVNDVRVPTSFGRCKGFAYVEFARNESLMKAVDTGAELSGRRLFLDADSGVGPKAGFHYRSSAYEQDGVKAGGGYKGGGKGGSKSGGKDGGKKGGKGSKGASTSW